MLILGIETSCDETAAAVIEDGQTMLSSVIASSLDLHVAYGGVVPEIAARSHIEAIMPTIDQAISGSGHNWGDIDAIAVTSGPGLGGSLLIGVMTARTLAIAKQKPLYSVNHVEAHVYANFIVNTPITGFQLPPNPPKFPILALIVSGGHTQLVLFRNHFDYTLLGQTADDAVGEAFDKVAKIIGLPYPGGPSIAGAALSGNPRAIKLPKAKMIDSYAFSFSGLKTAVLRAVQQMCGVGFDFPSHKLSELLTDTQRADIAASFQFVAVETLVDKMDLAFKEYRPASMVVAGGVAANQELRGRLASRLPLPVISTDIKLCTDNAAMIASLGYFKAINRRPTADPYSLVPDPILSM